VRWFVVLLLLANLILFFWVQQQSRPAPGSVGLPPPEIGRLRLLREADVALATDSADSLSAARGDDAAVPGAMQEAPPADGPNSGATGEVAVTHSEAPALVDAGTEGPSPEPSTELSGRAVSPAVVDATAKRPGVPPVAEPPGHAGAAIEADGAEPAPLCIRVGPLTPADADAMVARLPRELQLVSDTSEEYGQVDGYFVLIPALPSLAAAQQVLKDLEAAGVKDTWLFRGGDLRNAISLGVYSNRGGAQRHAELMARKGFTTAEVREKTSPAERRWLQLKGPEGGGAAAGLSLPKGATATPQACP